MKIACLQMDITFGDPEANYDQAADFLKKASDAGCELAVLPELWTTGYDLTRLDEIADHRAERAKAFLTEMAKQYNMHIVGGSVANDTGDGVKNTMIVVDKTGAIVHEYSKLHLFRLMNEEKYLIDGDGDGLFELAGEAMAGFICYDIRFPEWFRKQVLNGARVLFVPAEWPLARVDHWRTLLMARAIENQAYVVACNRSGSDPDNQFAGHSIIVGPWGEVIAEAGENEEMLIGDVDFDAIDEIRSRIPVFEDRRESFY
ncbi:carbon-nitrogen family hydrolase [Domibacillus sp. A3M-37]|uniref:carbon-nitrogen family hydrolase n=1 Tax=Domibacillus sp. A3M-37 TaxID=2962037 RepID=UPI0020B7B83B|nr:carbon-nitrogen family hydrolase [Domibacillus sp. A3M-37]MCP3762228.1 carbon-nitrogen family hydrolase [Domibacillus sp. A3M-37]